MAKSLSVHERSLSTSRSAVHSHRPRNRVRTTIRAAASNTDKPMSDGGRQPWDVGRFAQTVMFFNDLPTPQKILSAVASQPIKLLQSLISGNLEETNGAVLTVLAPQVPSDSISTSSESTVSSITLLRMVPQSQPVLCGQHHPIRAPFHHPRPRQEMYTPQLLTI
jgi:hypothetical protein